MRVAHTALMEELQEALPPGLRLIAAVDIDSLTADFLVEAASLSERLGAALTLVHVCSSTCAHAASAIDDIAVGMRGRGVSTYVRRVSGDPGPAIVELATILRPSVILIAEHRKWGPPNPRMGSVTGYVVTRARCPVLVFRGSAAPGATVPASRS